LPIVTPGRTVVSPEQAWFASFSRYFEPFTYFREQEVRQDPNQPEPDKTLPVSELVYPLLNEQIDSRARKGRFCFT